MHLQLFSECLPTCPDSSWSFVIATVNLGRDRHKSYKERREEKKKQSKISA